MHFAVVVCNELETDEDVSYTLIFPMVKQKSLPSRLGSALLRRPKVSVVSFMACNVDKTLLEPENIKPLKVVFAGWDEPDRTELRLLEHLHGSPPALRRRPDPDWP